MPKPRNKTSSGSGKPAPFPKERFLEFCSKVMINTKDYGLVPFKPLKSQLYILDEIVEGLNRGITSFVILKSRQMGSTSFLLILTLFWMFEHEGLSGAFIAHEDQAIPKFRSIIKTYLDGLPAGYRCPLVSENRYLITFQGARTLAYLAAGTKQKNSGSLGRSQAFNFKLATEVAYWGNEKDFLELNATLSAHYPFRLYIDETTANGLNWFKDYWDNAKESPTKKTIFLGWWRNEQYRFEKGTPAYDNHVGSNPQLTKLERQRMAEVKRQYGADITLEQIAWYRWQLIEEQGRDQPSMDEKYPWTEDDAFIATGRQYFSQQAITQAIRRARSIPFRPWRYSMGAEWEETEVFPGSARKHDLKVWQPPMQNHTYVAGIDPAFGSSDEADRTAISVWDCFADKAVQVAELCTPSISPYECAWAAAHLCGWYGEVLVILEISGPGSVVFQELNSLKSKAMRRGSDDQIVLRHIRHFLYRRSDSVKGEGLAYHWRMSRDLKWTIMGGFKDAFELGRASISSVQLLDEMRYISVSDGVIEAATGHDDCTVAAAMAIHAWKTWIQPKMIANGYTLEKSMRAKSDPKIMSITESKVMNYLREIRGEKQTGNSALPQTDAV